MGSRAEAGSQGIAAIGEINGAPGIVPTLAEMVKGVGQVGCGYESQLESWYRFLVDPEPYKSITVENNRSVLQGVDDELLAERKNFLRSDSLVAIVLLTDENDCSLTDAGIAFNAANGARLPALGTSARPIPTTFVADRARRTRARALRIRPARLPSPRTRIP